MSAQSALSALGDGTVMLAGAGKMGGALLEGWLKAGLPASQVAVRDPGPPPEIQALLAQHRIALNQDPKGEVAALILAVKPQVAPDVLPQLSQFAGANSVVVSVMAGRTISFLETLQARNGRPQEPIRSETAPTSAGCGQVHRISVSPAMADHSKSMAFQRFQFRN